MIKFDQEITRILSVSCNGKNHLYDHPMVYLKIDVEIGSVQCPYCSKIFKYQK